MAYTEDHCARETTVRLISASWNHPSFFRVSMENCLQFKGAGFNHEVIPRMALSGLQLGKFLIAAFTKIIPCLQKSVFHKNQLTISILTALSFRNSYDLKCLDFSICISVLLMSSKKIPKSCSQLPIRCMRNCQTSLGSLTWLPFLCHRNPSCSLPEILPCAAQPLTAPWTGCSNALPSWVIQEGWKTY